MKLKSNENWEVGMKCLKAGELNAAANRLYYAVFQAVCGWMRSKHEFDGQKKISHKDVYKIVKNVKTNYNPYTYEELRTLRETADYDKETPKRSDIERLLDDSEEIRELFLKRTV